MEIQDGCIDVAHGYQCIDEHGTAGGALMSMVHAEADPCDDMKVEQDFVK